VEIEAREELRRRRRRRDDRLLRRGTGGTCQQQSGGDECGARSALDGRRPSGLRPLFGV
jgi:hypothetical protein